MVFSKKMFALPWLMSLFFIMILKSLYYDSGLMGGKGCGFTLVEATQHSCNHRRHHEFDPIANVSIVASDVFE